VTIPVLWLVRFHAAATALWVVLMGPSLLWWKESIPWLVAMSVWANVAGHFAGWMGARSEAASADTIPPEPTRAKLAHRHRALVGRRMRTMRGAYARA
jgi:hypothetical protein